MMWYRKENMHVGVVSLERFFTGQYTLAAHRACVGGRVRHRAGSRPRPAARVASGLKVSGSGEKNDSIDGAVQMKHSLPDAGLGGGGS